MKYKYWLLSVGLCALVSTCTATSPAQAGPEQIKPKEIGALGQSDTCKGQIVTPKAIIMLCKKNHKAPVAVLQVQQDGTGVLDPDGFEYPKHLLLREMTEQTARRYWGNPKLNAGYRTFLLSSADNRTIEIEIDTTFKNKKLSAYRVRGTEISRDSWTSIKGGEQAEALPQQVMAAQQCRQYPCKHSCQ